MCCVCKAYIPVRADGRIEYRENPFWRNKHCPVHSTDGTTQCCACSRLQGRSDDWIGLQDGRQLCLDCLDTIVVDTKDAQPLYDEVLQFYHSMGMRHEYRAPVLLVDSSVLNDYAVKEGGRAPGPVFHVRGLTVAHVYRCVVGLCISQHVGGGTCSSTSRWFCCTLASLVWGL